MSSLHRAYGAAMQGVVRRPGVFALQDVAQKYTIGYAINYRVLPWNSS